MGLISFILSKLVSIACLFFALVFFLAGGMALSQNNFFGWIFLFLALILFLVALYYGKQE